MHKILDKILDGGPELVSAGYEVAEAELPVGHQRVERGRSEASALRYQGNPTVAQRLRKMTAEGGGGRFDVDEPHAIRPADAHSLVREGSKPQRPRLARPVTTFAEARGQHDRGANPSRIGLFQYITSGIGCRCDDKAIDGCGKVCDGRVTLIAEDFVVTRVDRKNLTLEARLPQVGEDVAPASPALRCPNHGNCLRGKQR